MLWSDERINTELDRIGDNRLDFTRGAAWATEMVMKTIRDEYEAKIAELERENFMRDSDAALLACLYAAGVEQWDGFDDACARNFRGEGKASATAKRIADLDESRANWRQLAGEWHVKQREAIARIVELEEECSRLRFGEAVEKAKAQQLKYGLEYQVECVQALQTKESEYLARITELDKHIVYLESMVNHYRSIEPHVKARIVELETKAAHLATIEAELVNQKAAYATVAHNLLNYRKIKLADNLRIIMLEAQLAAALAGNATAFDGYTESDTMAQLLNC